MTKGNGGVLMVTENGLFFIHRVLLLIAALLLAAHGVMMVAKYVFGHDHLMGLVPLFDFYEEQNIPTYFSSFNLLLTALLIFLIARLKLDVDDARPAAWKVLGAGFVFMSLDEFGDLRMLLKDFGRAALQNNDVLSSSAVFSVAWTIPIAILVVMIGFYFIPFLRSLGRYYAFHFLLAGGLFVLAALGLENVQGFHAAQTGGVRDLYFMALVTIEESIEIGAILYFQYFLIRYIVEMNIGERHMTIA